MDQRLAQLILWSGCEQGFGRLIEVIRGKPVQIWEGELLIHAPC